MYGAGLILLLLSQSLDGVREELGEWAGLEAGLLVGEAESVSLAPPSFCGLWSEPIDNREWDLKSNTMAV